MGADPSQLRQDIEYTRRQMSADVDALTEKVRPGRVVRRQAERTKGTLHRMKEQVMGTASDGTAGVAHGVSTAVSGVGDAAGSAVSTVGDTADAVVRGGRRQTEGNPLAAGLIAFGAGWLVSSLLPATRSEQRAAAVVTETVREKAQPALQEAGVELRDNLREPVQQAVESVKSTAGEAASTVQEQAKSSTQDVAHDARQAGQTVRDEARS